MSHPTLHNFAAALPITLLLFGTNALLRPATHLSHLGFSAYTPTTNPQAAKLNLALMRIWGIRNVVVGSTLLMVWRQGNEELLAGGIALGSLLAIVDGFVSRSLGSGVAMHWGTVPVCLGIATGLLGWW